MKSIIYPAILGVVLSSCGAGEVNSGDALSALIQQRDSMRKAKDDISAKLSVLEMEILALDTNKSLPVVSTFKVPMGTFSHSFEVYGELNTDQNAVITAEIGGTILDLPVDEGVRVTKGQTLMRIDVQALREQEQELKTRLELAEITFRKQEKLWNEKIGSEMQYLQAKNNRDALQNSLDALRAQISKGVITAPFDGVVDEVFPKKGETAMPGMALLRIVNLSNLYITADISENFVGKVRKGDKVKVTIPSTGQVRHAEITRTGDYINPNNRTFKIKASIENTDGLLKPNMVAQIEVQDFVADSAVYLPQTLVLEGAGGKNFVYVVRSDNGISIAEKREVSVGRASNGQVLIETGLQAGEQIVEKGARSIKDGEKIDIKNNVI
ncbi:MAG: efflux RND transporter periplasmic adaptor subunit [Flavobacteriales bacterium]|nr:efflux RND transporter periplasmic adaptor subunit [Flavobacteriales bacterium]